MDRGRNIYGRNNDYQRKSQRNKTNQHNFEINNRPFDDLNNYFSQRYVRNQDDIFRFRGRSCSSSPSPSSATSAVAAAATATIATTRPKLFNDFMEQNENGKLPARPSYPCKRLLEDNESEKRKIFASAEKMAEKMSRLKIENDPSDGDVGTKRLYFNTDIDAIQSMSMIDMIFQDIQPIDNSKALVLWQPPLLPNLNDCNDNELLMPSNNKTSQNNDYDDDDDDNCDVFIDDDLSMVE